MLCIQSTAVIDSRASICVLTRTAKRGRELETQLLLNKKPTKRSILYLVHQVGESLQLIRDEVARWRKILEVPYQEYLLSK